MDSFGLTDLIASRLQQIQQCRQLISAVESSPLRDSRQGCDVIAESRRIISRLEDDIAYLRFIATPLPLAFDCDALSARAAKAVARLFGELRAPTVDDLLSLRGCGKNTALEIINAAGIQLDDRHRRWL